jgi:hypothetical protein
MHMEGVLLAAYVGCQSCFNRSDRCIYWPEQGNCLPIFGAFSILLHVHCAPFLSFSTIRPSSILNSPRFHAYWYLPSFCLSHASPGLHLFPSLLFSGSFVQCAQLFLQFLTFLIPGRSIIIVLSGDVHPRIKAPFPFENILSRPWSVKISLTDGPSCWIHLVKPWIEFYFALSEKWAVGVMGCWSNGLSE